MPSTERPEAARLSYFKTQAKQFLKDYKSGHAESTQRIEAVLPHLLEKADFRLADAQSVIARENGFDSWRKLIQSLPVSDTPSSQDLSAHPRFEEAHRKLAIQIGEIFSELHNADIACDLSSIEDSRFAKYFNSLSPQRWIYTFLPLPVAGPAIIDFSNELIWHHIYRESGGLSGDIPKERRDLLAEEQVMMDKAIKLILNSLTQHWNAYFAAKINTRDVEAILRPSGREARITRYGDQVSTVILTLSADKLSGTLRLCYPEKLVEWATKPRLRFAIRKNHEEATSPGRQGIEVAIPSEIQLEEGMVYVEAGPFMMGDSKGAQGEGPSHKVDLDAFWIDRFPVTNEDYARFVDETDHDPPSVYDGGQLYEKSMAKHPVVAVSYDDAQAYATWAGKRLPTEAEWEKAARGTKGQAFPWGDFYETKFCNAEDIRSETTLVNQYPEGKSPYGAVDMCGNVLEWVSDWYDEAYYASGENDNPKGPSLGKYRVLRGGSFEESEKGLRCAARYWAPQDAQRRQVGFRCVKDVSLKERKIPDTQPSVSSQVQSASNGRRKLTKSQRVKIEHLHKQMAKRMEVEHTHRNQHITDVFLGYSDETTMGEVVQSLWIPCHSYTFKLTPPGAYCFIDYALPVRNEFLKLNGISMSEGLVTDEEQDLMAEIVRQDLADLKTAWEPIEVVKATDINLEQDRDKLDIVKGRETVIHIGFECNMQHANGIISVTYPLSVIENFLPQIDRFVTSV